VGGGRDSLKVSVVRGGGLTGLVITTTVDSAALSSDDASTLRAMVDGADLAGLPPTTSRPNHPDAESFRITVENDGNRESVVLTERDLSPAVRSLIEWVESAPAREESVNPPG
jgi:DNA-binding transcriptional LysR family regulator